MAMNGRVILGLVSCWALGCAASKAPPAPASLVVSRSEAVVPAPAPAAAPVVSKSDAGRTVHWQGSRVSLWAPNSMNRPTRLQYLRQDEPLVVVALAEMTADNEPAIAQMLAGAKRGAGVTGEMPVTRGTARGFVGQGTPDDTGLARRVLALSDGLAAAIVIAQYAEAAAPLVEKILESVKLDGRAELDPLALSGISIGDDAGFAVSNATSHPVMLFEKGRRPPLDPGEPSFVLISLPYPRPNTPDEELGNMLGVMLAKFEPFMPAAKTDEFPIAGRPGFVISLPGKNGQTPIGLYGFVARSPDVAFAGFGHVRVKGMNQVAPRFERLVRSIKLDDSIVTAPVAGSSVKAE